MDSDADTIFAISSGAGRAGVAVVRISGAQSRFVAETLAGGALRPRYASLRHLRDPRTKILMDQGLVLWFPGPASFTGEDCIELHIHGGRAVSAALLACLASFPGLRHAQAGEFTLRAFINGKLDLSEVEGLADLIDSDTERQRQQALDQMKGGLSQQVRAWRDVLLAALALVSAEIDFGDDEADAPAGVTADVQRLIVPIIGQLRDALSDQRASERLREGLLVVIGGAPNVGKSTLMNRLAGRDIAIVSEIAGTTRDVLEVTIDVDGVPIHLADTAGLRDAATPAEVEGVTRARARMAKADLVLWLFDGGAAGGASVVPPPNGATLWRIATKADVLPPGTFVNADFVISALTGGGIDELLGALARHVTDYLPAAGAGALTRARHREACGLALAALQRVSDTRPALAAELIADELTLAARALARIFGMIDVEEILGDIFSRFCIGK